MTKFHEKLERIVRLVAFDNIARTLLLVLAGYDTRWYIYVRLKADEKTSTCHQKRKNKEFLKTKNE